MAQQAFIAEKPNVGKTINNFITRLQELAEHCDYDEERDNQVRDHAISHIKDRNLRANVRENRAEFKICGHSSKPTPP